MARAAEPCELTVSTVIDDSVQNCWNRYIDTALVPQWAPAIQKVECSASTLAEGVCRKSHVLANGKAGHTVEVCTYLDPLKRIDISVTEETFGFSHMLTSYGFSTTFDVDGDQTLIVMKTHYTPKKIFASVMTSSATQNQLMSLMTDSLQGFKRYMETSTPA